jgi:hypothetical protein
LIASPLEIFCEFILAEAIQNAFFRHAALARHLDAPMRQVNFPRRVRIRVDAHDAAKTQGRLVPAPVKVKPPGVRVDFNGDAVLRAGRENLLDIDVIAWTAQKLPPGHMPEDGRVWI